jgi:hypothetical protein
LVLTPASIAAVNTTTVIGSSTPPNDYTLTTHAMVSVNTNEKLSVYLNIAALPAAALNVVSYHFTVMT